MQRPSWVDAKLALKQVYKGRIDGALAALWVRAHTQNLLFALGATVQNHAGKMIFAALLILTLLCIGLKHAQVETNFQRLWIEEGGRLQHELEYVESSVKHSSVQQLVVQVPTSKHSSVLTTAALLTHLRVLRAASSVSVTLYDRTWTLRELCITMDTPSYEDHINRVMENISPCIFISPLDCFWESSLLASDSTKVVQSFPHSWSRSPGSGNTDWTSLDPLDFLKKMRLPKVQFDDLKEYFERVGISHGYQNRPCLNQSYPGCPSRRAAPSRVDVRAVLGAGCAGLASQHMRWPRQLLLGGVRKDRSDNLISASALQTVIPLMGASNVFDRWKDTWRTNGMPWNARMAENVLSKWQEKFVNKIEELSGHDGHHLYSFSMSSLQDFMKQFAELNTSHVVTAYGLLVMYAFLSLYRCWEPVESQGGLAVAGILLISLSTASGLGLCALLGLKFNACSTQVIPFLVMGMSLNDMFIFSQTYSFTDFSGIAFNERVGEVVKRAGIGVLLTSLCNISAFLCAAILPIRAVRQFAIQAAVLVSVNSAVMLLVYPALLTVDIRRRRHRLYDVVCCWREASDTPASCRGNCKCSEQLENTTSSSSSPGTRCQDSVSLLQTANMLLPLRSHWRSAVLLAMFFAMAATVWGALKVKDGLELTDVVPRFSSEYDFFDAQKQYFGVFNMFAVTQGEFDYPNNQKLLYKYHKSFVGLPFIIKDHNGGLSNFWLKKFHDWLLGLQESFEADWKSGVIVREKWYDNASDEGILAYKLLVQTGRLDSPIDNTRLPRAKLVNNNIVNPQVFYKYLSAWAHNDALAYQHSGAAIFPEPKRWYHDRYDRQQLNIPTSSPIQYAQIPLYMSGLDQTEQILDAIQKVRQLCQRFEVENLPNFPSGVAFTFWEQYLHLRFLLLVALSCVLLVTLLLVAVALMNAWAAVFVLALQALTVSQFFAAMGFLRLRLNAVTATMLVLSVGVTMEFAVHIVLSFLTCLGDRSTRVKKSLELMFRPLFHGAVSTLVGVIMLCFSEYDFIARYFGFSLVSMVVLSMVNGLVLLPVLLAMIGPDAEVRSVEDKNTMPLPSPQVVHTRTVGPRVFESSTQRTPAPSVTHAPSRLSLSTITEESGSSNSSEAAVCNEEKHSTSSAKPVHDIVVEPQVVVETSYPQAGQYSGGDVHITTTVTATTRVRVEVHTPSRRRDHTPSTTSSNIPRRHNRPARRGSSRRTRSSGRSLERCS